MSTIVVHGLSAAVPIVVGGGRSAELADAVLDAWSRCLAPAPDALAAEPVHALLLADGESAPAPGDGDRGVSSTDLDRLMQSLTQAVTSSLIAARTGRLLMFHAGGVSLPDGRSLVMVAPGGTGKTTLTRRLAGAAPPGLPALGYLSDETVALDPASGIIHPYPKPLSLRPEDGRGPKLETSPDALGLGVAPSAPRLAQLVLLRRPRGHEGPPALTLLSTLDALVALTPETSALGRLDRPLHAFEDVLLRLPPVRIVEYAEGADVAPLLRGLLEDA